jgi:diguanylate cyclase (GGDEF)-like protein
MDKKDEKLCLFLIDVDDFKMINDTYGHETGDKVLQHFSNVLLNNTIRSDIVARLAGDEFLIISPSIDGMGKDLLIKRIHEDLKNSIEKINLEISVSIGTSEYPSDAKTLDVLLDIADQQMYKLKSQKKNNIKNDSIWWKRRMHKGVDKQ